MRALVTFGPTFEPLDDVRRLTNFSTGQLGTELANFLAERGHQIVALRGHYATYRGECRAAKILPFTTTANLLATLRQLASQPFDAVFHAAAISDFSFGGVFEKEGNGSLRPITSGKYATDRGSLLVELVPTPKIIHELPSLFPSAKIFGWKYEVDGSKEHALELGQKQLQHNRTHYCVVNGPAYGAGFGLVSKDGLLKHCPERRVLNETLLELSGATARGR